MSIKKLTKEELETMSYNDIAYLIIKEEKEQSTLDLFNKVGELLELPKKTIENKIGDFYTSLTTDKRFLLLDGGLWDLRSNHKTSNLIQSEDLEDDDIEIEENYDDPVEDEEDIEDIYADDMDDETDDSVDEYKNLVIVDEEDLGLEE